MTKQQELQVRRQAAAHLRGTPARQNAAQIEMLETQLLMEELTERFGADQIAAWERMEESVNV